MGLAIIAAIQRTILYCINYNHPPRENLINAEDLEN